MPNYDFRCTSCDTVFLLERPLGHCDDESCPHCGSVAKRVFQVFEKQPSLGCDKGGCDDNESPFMENLSLAGMGGRT
ncbi:MAG: zinc ribbon domain-containing protein [Coriobacteriales bacterium]|nr:zinc ribbon domain-containing protein [Coriobacteriales bacterium]